MCPFHEIKAPIPASQAEQASFLRDMAVENIAETEEELMERYLEEGTLSEEDLAAGLRRGVINGSLVPVVAGAALRAEHGGLVASRERREFQLSLLETWKIRIC